jgi:AcrR family transcriptional regulator
MRTARDSPRRPGRPLEARPREAAIQATLDLIAEHGIRGLTTNAVAARAGISKATLYRRWRSKQELVVDAIAALVSDISVPDTGTTHTDLLELMRNAVRVYSGSLEAGVMPSVIDAMSRDAELARAVRNTFLARRRAALRAVLERGMQRGDLRADLDVELALDVLGGPLFYRLLVTGGPIDDQLAEGVADLIVRGFAPFATPPTSTLKTGEPS